MQTLTVEIAMNQQIGGVKTPSPALRNLARFVNAAPSANLFNDMQRAELTVVYNDTPKNQRPRREDFFFSCLQLLIEKRSCLDVSGSRNIAQKVIDLHNACPTALEEAITCTNEAAARLLPRNQRNGAYQLPVFECWFREFTRQIIEARQISSGTNPPIKAISEQTMRSVEALERNGKLRGVTPEIMQLASLVVQKSKDVDQDILTVCEHFYELPLGRDKEARLQQCLAQLNSCYSMPCSFIAPAIETAFAYAKAEKEQPNFIARHTEYLSQVPAIQNGSERAAFIAYLFSRQEHYPEKELRAYFCESLSRLNPMHYERIVSLRQRLGKLQDADAIYTAALETIDKFLEDDIALNNTLEALARCTGRDFNAGMRLLGEIGTLGKIENTKRLLREFQSLGGQYTVPLLQQALYRTTLEEHAEKFPERPLEAVAESFLTAPEVLERATPDEVHRACSQYKEILHISGQYAVGRFPKPLRSLSVEEYIGIGREEFKKNYGVYPFNTQVLAMLIAVNRLESGQPMHGIYSQVRTGEGKSLIISMLAGYFAQKGMPVDILTANDYLAERDVQKFSTFFESMGLQCTNFSLEKFHGEESEDCESNAQIGKSPHIVYSTETDVAIHYLNCGLSGVSFFEGERFGVLLADESDYLMLDSHSRSVRIARGAPNRLLGEDEYRLLMQIGDSLDGTFPTLSDLIDESLRKLGELPTTISTERLRMLSREQLFVLLHSTFEAREMKRDVHFTIDQDNELVILDRANTGRQLAGMHWSYGLHSMVALQSGANFHPDQDTMVSHSLHHFINRYATLLCVSGTIGNEGDRAQLRELYNLKGFDTPSHNPSIRIDSGITLLDTEEEAKEVRIRSAIEEAQKGRPVLLMAGSVDESKEFYERLREMGYLPQLLNDVHNRTANGMPASEEEIISQAGQAGMITVATYIAGRGTDIVTTPEANARGGLHVILPFPDNVRVEGQARGRAGRQGCPGTSEIICSLEDPFFEGLTEAERELLMKLKTRLGNDHPTISAIIQMYRDVNNEIMMQRELLACALDAEHDDIIRSFFERLPDKATELFDRRKLTFKDATKENVIREIVNYWTENYQHYDTIKQLSAILYTIGSKQLISACQNGAVPQELEHAPEVIAARRDIQAITKRYEIGDLNAEEENLHDILETYALRLYFARADKSTELWREFNGYLAKVVEDAFQPVRRGVTRPKLQWEDAQPVL